MDVLLVVDMQQGLLQGAPKHDVDGVVARINAVARAVRARSGRTVFIQHNGSIGDIFEPDTPGWQLLDTLEVASNDIVVHKTLNDPFFDNTLHAALQQLGANRLIVSGWATDFCVDATVRSAVAHGYEVVVLSDGHTLSDRPHLGAEQVMAHHHFIWANLIATKPIVFRTAATMCGE